MTKKLPALFLTFLLLLAGVLPALAEEAPAAARLSLSETKLKLMRSQTAVLTATAQPKGSELPLLRWSTSDPEVAQVTQDGTVTPVHSGQCVIRCEAAEDDSLRAECQVRVSTISVPSTEITVTDPQGMMIPIDFEGRDITSKRRGSRFEIASSIKRLVIWPYSAGKGTVTLSDTGDSANDITLQVTIDPSAAFDTTPYPSRRYEELRHHLDDYDGQRIFVFGRITSVGSEWTERSDYGEEDPDPDYYELGLRMPFYRSTIPEQAYADEWYSPSDSYIYLNLCVKYPKTETGLVPRVNDQVKVYGVIHARPDETETGQNTYRMMQRGRFQKLQSAGYIDAGISFPDGEDETREEIAYESYIQADYLRLKD